MMPGVMTFNQRLDCASSFKSMARGYVEAPRARPRLREVDADGAGLDLVADSYGYLVEAVEGQPKQSPGAQLASG